MALTVRLARVDDADQIARVHVTAWRVAYSELIPEEYLASLDVGERSEVWRSALAGEQRVAGLPDAANLVAELGGLVVGFATVGRFRDDPHDEALGELWAMYVDPDSWGAGVGDALMAATFEELARLGAASSYLWVLEGNDRAIRFYERHGWRPDGIRKTFVVAEVEVPEVRFSLHGAND